MKRTLNVYNNSPLKLISTCMSVPRQCHSLLESQSSPGPGWYHIYWGNRTPSSPTGSSLGSDPRPGRKSAVLLDLSSLWSYSRDFCIHLSYTEHIWSSFQFHCYIKEMHKIKNKFKQIWSSLRISFISSIICVYKLNNKITCICDVCPLDRY